MLKGFAADSGGLFVFDEYLMVRAYDRFALDSFPRFIGRVLFSDFGYLETFRVNVSDHLMAVYSHQGVIGELRASFGFGTVGAVFGRI